MNTLSKANTAFYNENSQRSSEELVTVAISLYNYANFLPECLDSILLQRYSNLDIIIVDDASHKDDSLQVAYRWLSENEKRFGRSILLQHKRNQGLAQSRNTAFENARSEFVFVIDADNSIYPRAIERLVSALHETAVQAAYSQLEFFGAEQRLGYADVWKPNFFLRGNYVDAMALVSRKAWKEVDGYTHIEGGWEDYDFWCKFVEKGFSAAFVPEILCRYRVHANSMLRTETINSYKNIFTEMTLRHPWLDLIPSA